MQSSMESNTIDLVSYLTFFELQDYITKRPSPNLESLTKVVKQHTTKTFYQNVDLQTKAVRGDTFLKEDLAIPSIQKTMIDDKRGGMCFDQNLLLEAALTALGFNVKLAAACVLPYNPEQLPTHSVLLVEIDSEHYLVDSGFGFNNIRAPLKFDFKGDQEVTVLGHERYQLIVEPTYYKINHITLEGKDLGYSYFMREGDFPRIATKDEVLANYERGMNNKKELAIRDSKLYIGGYKGEGRIGLSFDKKLKSGNMLSQKDSISEVIKAEEYKDFEEFVVAAKKYFGIEVPAELQKAYECKE